MHTSMFIWKPHPGKLKEMREMVITIRDHCRRIGGANEVNCAALQGSFFGHFAVAMKCENGIAQKPIGVPYLFYGLIGTGDYNSVKSKQKTSKGRCQ